MSIIFIMEEKILDVVKDIDQIRGAKAGQTLLLCGDILSARDAAHKRISELLESGKPLPIDIKDKLIYYLGPTPTRPDQVIGSCGPTSSYRMDKFYEMMCRLGSLGSIGKGERSDDIRRLVQQYRSPYFVTFGGAAAYLAKCVSACSCAAFDDLGAEAVYRLTLDKFPVVCAYDIDGNSVFNNS